LNNIKNTGKPLAGGSAASSPVKKTATSTPKKTAPRAKAGAAKTKKTMSASASASDSESNQPEGFVGEDDNENPDTPSMVHGKRNMSIPKRSYAESDQSSEDSEVEDEYTPMAKRVKTEPVDEESSLSGGNAVQFGDGLNETEI
jgi:hypothetical protein